MVKFWRGRNIILAGGTMLAGIFGAQTVSADNSGISFTVSVPDVPVLEISVYDEDGNLMTDGQETLMEVTPTMALAGFNTTGMKVTVGTSSAAGYKLAMQVANDGTLVSENSDVIPSLASDEDESGNKFTCTTATAASCNFTVNSWGYWMTGDEANAYKPVPSVQTQLVNYTAGATDGEDTDFAFAVRANAKQAAGDYETTINFIATANPEFSIHSLTYMQDFNVLTPDDYAAVVDSMTEDESYELVDNRDNKTYNIAKLKGGYVWLQDNLQLDIAANKANITSATTNANDTTLGYLKNGGGSSPYTTDAAVNTSASAWSGDVRYTKAMYNTEYADYDASYGNGTHKSGYYYNYCAASAGSYCYAKSSAPSNTNATQDICPAGWQMPAGDTSTYSYQKLYEAYGSNAADFKNALHAGLSGRFNGGIYGQGSSGNGYFWSATRTDGIYMYYLYVSASGVGPQNYYNRYDGLSVRCVLKENENNVAINFNGNGATSGGNRTLGYKAGSGVTIPGAGLFGFEKAGKYGFAGWNTKADGSGTSYAAGASVTITAEMNGLTLYAQWQEVTIAMQDADSTSLGNLLTNNGDITYLYDSRDDNVYTIGKLNGKYWMLDNLALGGSTAMTLTGEDTNLATASTKYILPASGTQCFTNQNTTCTGTDGTTTGNGYTVAAINADYKTTTSANNTDFTYNSNGDVSKAGVYYNYCAASAGTYCYAAESSSGDASYDVCPKGWRLPTGGGSGEFQALTNNLVGETTQFNDATKYATFKAAFRAGLSGNFYDGSVQNQTSLVFFWSSTRMNTVYMHDLNLNLNTTAVNPRGANYRYLGLSVRCVYGG